VQSLLLYQRFVNNICSATRQGYLYAIDDSILTDDEVAYDCAATGSEARLK
jgi:hypothetical protein